MRPFPPFPWPALALALALPLNSRALPLITKVVETGGDNEATDTVTAKFTGETFSNGIAGEFQNPYTVGKFVEDVPAMVDRAHQWNGGTDAGLPSYLVGGEYIMSGNDNRDNAAYRLDITVSEPVMVYLLVDNRLTDATAGDPPEGGADLASWTLMTWLAADGFAPMLNGLNRTGDPSIPDEVGVDEAGDGVGPGVSIQNWSSVYARSVPAGTFTIREFNGGGINMYGVVIARSPGSPNNPPEITDLKPANNTLLHPASGGLSFTARTVSPNSIAAANLKLQLNGTDVSANLTVTGNNLARTAAYSALQPDRLYWARAIAVDQAGRGSTNDFFFDTFGASAIAVEAEDYDHGGGKFVAGSTPGGYANLAGLREVDYHNNNRTAPTATYRTGDFVGVAAAGDSPRSAFTAAGATDYQANALQAGDWLQYTRSLPEATYEIYLRAAAAAYQQVRLDRVVGGVATPVGTFNLGPHAAGTFGTFALSEGGDPLRLRFSGETTLRLTPLQANVNLGLNYLLLVPSAAAPSPAYFANAGPFSVPDAAPDVAVRVRIANGAAAPTPGSITLRFDDQDVTAAATITPDSSGISVVYDPPGRLDLGSQHGVGVHFQGASGIDDNLAWGFTVTTNLVSIPAAYGTPTGSGQGTGFALKIRKAPDANAAGTAQTLANTTLRAEQQLADRLIDPDTTEPYVNEAAGPGGDGKATATVINFDQLAASSGYFPDDAAFPHVDLGASPDPNNLAMEVTAYVELAAGIHRLGVRSDDGFRVTTGPTFAEANLPLGVFEGGRGDGLPAGATEFEIDVETAGVYPIRLVWYEGNGGARLELYSVNRETFVRTLLNDTTAAGALKAYPTRSTQIFVPTVTLTSPTSGKVYATGPTNLTVSATASLQGGQITKVEFFDGGTNKIGEATTAPFQVVWPGVNPGRRSVLARATGSNGLTKDTDLVRFLVGTPISINFQAATAETPEGYLADTGEVFGDRGNGYSYGWDVDNTANSRDRNDARSPDERYDTFNHLQKPLPAGRLWEIEVPNGRYTVFAAVGEAANIDSTYDLTAEDVSIVKGTPTDSVRFYDGQGTVTVSDGRLSIGNGPTASNNKVCFVDIFTAPAVVESPKLNPPTLAGGNVVITWTHGGTLESAPSPTGPWASTGDSDGSYSEAASAAAKFFRVKR